MPFLRRGHYKFKDNKKTYQPNKRNAFDNAGAYNESSNRLHGVRDHDQYEFLPMDDWIIRQRMLGKCGDGTNLEQYEVGETLGR